MSFYFSPKIVTNGLVLYLDAANTRSYPTTGTTWSDLTISGNNGTLTNGPTFSSESLGVFSFDGVNDYVSLPVNSTTQPTNNFTVCVWANWTSFGGNSNGFPLIGQSNVGSNSGFLLYQGTGPPYNSVKAYVNTSTSGLRVIESPFNILTSRWYYICLMYDSVNIYLYINGVSITSTPQTGNINYGASVFQIATNTTGVSGYFRGKIPMVKLYRRALTASEILQNFNATKGRYGLL